jgi:hypothetical protein
MMVAIEVDFEVFKALTARRETETVSCNDVIRGMLKLPTAKHQATSLNRRNGATFKGVFFPDGTEFKGTHKRRTYTALIKDGEWVGEDGVRRTSPSDAAVAVTGKNWNGWVFWFCRMPGETSWRLINELRQPVPPLSAL